MRAPLVSLAAAAALTAALYAVVAEVSGYGDLGRTLTEAHPGWLALAVAGQALAYAGYALGYRGTARAGGGPRLRYGTALRVVVLGFGGHVVGSSAGGIAVSLWALRHAGESLRGAARRAIAIATLEWLVLAVAASAAAAFLLAGGTREVPRGMTLAWIGVTAAAVVLAVVLTSPRLPIRVRLATGRPRSRALAAVRGGLATGLDAVRLVRRIVGEPLRHGGAIAGFAAYWAGDLLTLHAALRAFEVRLALPALVLAYASGYAIASAPLPLGASGAAEASLTVALAAVGVALAPAALAVLAYRVCTFWLPLLPALALLPSLRRLGGELEASARAGE